MTIRLRVHNHRSSWMAVKGICSSMGPRLAGPTRTSGERIAERSIDCFRRAFMRYLDKKTSSGVKFRLRIVFGIISIIFVTFLRGKQARTAQLHRTYSAATELFPARLMPRPLSQHAPIEFSPMLQSRETPVDGQIQESKSLQPFELPPSSASWEETSCHQVLWLTGDPQALCRARHGLVSAVPCPSDSRKLLFIAVPPKRKLGSEETVRPRNDAHGREAA